MLPEAFNVPIPDERRAQAAEAAGILGDTRRAQVSRSRATRSRWSPTYAEALLNRTWRPALSVTGAEGLPPIASAGNVLRPQTSLEAVAAAAAHASTATAATADLQRLFEADPPGGANVTFTPDQAPAAGTRRPWRRGSRKRWRRRRRRHYGKPVAAMGEGGTIPFMAMLGRHFPEAQFLITGVLGPHSNAHGPNEFLHIPYAKKLTACVAHVLAAHAARGAA